MLVGSFIEGKRPSVLSISVRVATAGEIPHFLFLEILPPGESCSFILRLISHLKRTERMCLSLVIVSVSVRVSDKNQVIVTISLMNS